MKPAPLRPSIRRKPQAISTTDALLAAARGWELRPLKTPARKVILIGMYASAAGVIVAVLQYAAALPRVMP